MRDLLRSLAQQGKTIFISSHVLGEVQQICSRVAIINLGRLVREAAVEDLTRGTGEFVVQVQDAETVLATIRQQPWGRQAAMQPDGFIRTPAPQGQGRLLAQFLAQGGVFPDQIIQHAESLEEVFLRLTSNGTEVH